MKRKQDIQKNEENNILTDGLLIFQDVQNKKPIMVNLQELIKSRALLQASSGGFNNGISKLVSLGLAERGHEGMIRVSDEMFP